MAEGFGVTVARWKWEEKGGAAVALVVLDSSTSGSSNHLRWWFFQPKEESKGEGNRGLNGSFVVIKCEAKGLFITPCKLENLVIHHIVLDDQTLKELTHTCTRR